MSKVIVRLQITNEAKECLEQYCERTGRTQIAALSRIIERLNDEPAIVQGFIGGDLPSSLEKRVREIVVKNVRVSGSKRKAEVVS